MQERLSSKDIIKCESLDVKGRGKEQINIEKKNSDIVSHEKKDIFPEEDEREYDDNKIKISKKFTLADLRKRNMPQKNLIEVGSKIN